MWANLRYTLRQLRKAPGFTVTAVLTLALGIGATTAIFTLVQQVMLKSLPVARPSELYRIGDQIHCCVIGGYTQSGRGDNEYSLFSYELYRHFRDHTPEFADLAGFEGGDTGLGVRRSGVAGRAELRIGQFVSGNFFSTFGVGAWAGRVFTPADDREDAAPVAVMAYHTWQQKYGSDPSVVGASFELNGKSFTIVGIGAPGFFGAGVRTWGTPDLWIPFSDEPMMQGTSSLLNNADQNWIDVIGRVRPGTDPKALEAKLRLELRQWQLGHIEDMQANDRERLPKQQLFLTPGGAGVAQMRARYEDGLRLLLLAAGCVLLIACANLTNLLLARGLARRQQLSVRMALGASRALLVRKALFESVVLGVLGGVAGLLVAYGGTSLILHFAFSGGDHYVPIQASPSWTVLLFAMGLSALTGVVFGIAPAWISSHAEPVEALRGANRSSGQKIAWPQKALVISQAALSLVLLSAAAMLTQSLRNLEHQSFGFKTEGRYVATVEPLLAGYQPNDLPMLYRQIEDRLQAIPGVRGASSSLYAPMSGDNWDTFIRIEGRPEPAPGEDVTAGYVRIEPGFFQTLGTRMLQGRSITEDDTASSRHVAVVNDAFAKHFFPGQNPIGQHFGKNLAGHAGDMEIIGVVADIQYLLNAEHLQSGRMAEPMFFMPETQFEQYLGGDDINSETRSHYLRQIVLWAPGNPPGLEEKVRNAVAEVNPDLTVESFSKYDELLSADYAQEQLIARLTMLFGALALVLAAVGLYGVTAYSVEQRSGEIGIRMALGADRQSVVAMVLRGAFLQVGLGLVLGIPAAIGVGRAIAGQLFGVAPYDPLLLALAALFAATVPARRAASVDPMAALRND
ncbi:ABC transporter permease [Silvibacterium dinghuense]|uniref:ABC transporter permease n=1 Tax=Silvibacterium dinghuense TaxID=1560006 RepID=A0A4Q1SI98_9BACT|nr:ABC transporter permease [Silvibacterium dinghuense]RXS97117.1 ABC transporter permease [Silvibacterium dinghuense]GGG96398.1 hypothetical protein GCM10011586_09430 [Silvibacterium dinghuense]